MPLPTYGLSILGAVAGAANYPVAIIEAGPKGPLRLQRIIVWNPGFSTAAMTLQIETVTQTTVGSGSTVTPATACSTDVFSGICRQPGATPGTLGAAIGYGEIVTAAAVADAAYNPPAIFEFNTGGNEKAPVCFPGIPAALNSLTNTNWYMIASLGTTTNSQWLACGAANNPATGTVTVGTIFQANATALSGTGTVTPLVLATALSAGTWYAIASQGTTTNAQWQAVGAPAYIAPAGGTNFKATGAAVGTGLCVALGSGAGFAVLIANGGAGLGLGGLNMTIEFTEG